MVRVAKYGDLLADPDMKRWHDNLAAGSPITAEVYLRTLGLYCELEKMSPKEIIERAESKVFRDSGGSVGFRKESKDGGHQQIQSHPRLDVSQPGKRNESGVRNDLTRSPRSLE